MYKLNTQIREINNGYLIQNYSPYVDASETFCDSLPAAFKTIEEQVALKKNKEAADTTLAYVDLTSEGIA